MAYLGRAPQYGAFQTQSITPTGVDTTYSLDYAVASAASILVSIGGVLQKPEEAYTIGGGGTEIVFSEAPDSSLSIFVVYLGEKLVVGQLADNSLTTNMVSNYQITSQKMSNTGVTATVYGGSSQIPVINIDQAGRVTSAANVAVSLGTIASQNADNISITGGAVTGLSNLTTSNFITSTGSITTAEISSANITTIASTTANVSTANVITVNASNVSATTQLFIGAYNYRRVDLGTLSSNTTLDLSQGNYFKCTIQTGSTITFTTTNAPTGNVTTGFILDMTGGGSSTVSLASLGSSDTLFQGGVHPTISTQRDLYSCITADNGATFCVLPIFVFGS